MKKEEVIEIIEETKDDIEIGDIARIKCMSASDDPIVKIKEKYKIIESDSQDKGVIYYRGEVINKSIGTIGVNRREFTKEEVIEHYKLKRR